MPGPGEPWGWRHALCRQTHIFPLNGVLASYLLRMGPFPACVVLACLEARPFLVSIVCAAARCRRRWVVSAWASLLVGLARLRWLFVFRWL